MQGLQEGVPTRSALRQRERERQRNQTEKRKAYHAANLKRWRRARKLHAEGDFTVEEFEALYERYGEVCLRCGRIDFLLTPDHVVPLSPGGGDLISNIQPLCGGCNSWKNVKAVDHRPDTALA